MSREYLENIIRDFDPGKFGRFFEEKSPSFHPLLERDRVLDDDHFRESRKIGVFDFEGGERVGVYAFQMTSALSERSGKKLQFEKGREILKDPAYHAGIFIFSDPAGNFRFSLIYKQFIGTKRTFNHFKRYTYFVGKDLENKTFKQQIGGGNFSSIATIRDAFSVEKVTKEFFEKYRELFNQVYQFLADDRAFSAFSVKHGIRTDVFAKKLLGQIVFLYFLQKKGWLGAKKNDHISNGDMLFVRNLFRKSQEEQKNFFNEYLEHLFYDALNKVPEKAGSFYREKFDGQIPFLNGGLFEPLPNYDWKGEFLYLPDELFSNSQGTGILDIFDRYNFTVDENTPNDQEVSVDPEMLGKVFENLLEVRDRKSKGTYYTPREIVQYICQESLTGYLDSNSKIGKGKIEKYISFLDGAEDSIAAFEDEARELDALLQKLKVCDPACGSGAFLVGMLNEIVRFRILLQSLDESLPRKTAYELKKETIQNSIYGVDIDSGAVDIAKLRFWLSMVVEENIEEIEPLPNLDYKIMQGNSLLENLVVGESVITFRFDSGKKLDGRTNEMKNLFEESRQARLFSIDKSETLADRIEKYHAEFFRATDPSRKKTLKKKIDDIEDELIRTKCAEEIDRLENEIRNRNFDEKMVLKDTRQILSIRETLNAWSRDRFRPFFPWKLHFSEVFQDEGFDVVIGNPPYVQIQKFARTEMQAGLEKAGYEVFAKTGDLYSLFYERGLELTKKSTGLLCFITSNKWMRAGYGEKLRGYFARKNPLFLLDFGGFKVFESATVDTNILLIGNDKNRNVLQACHFQNDYRRGESLKGYCESRFVALKDLSSDTWFIGSAEELALKAKIERVGKPLKEWDVQINYGIKTGLNEAFIIDQAKRDELVAKDPKSAEILRPILRGRDIKRYGYDWARLYIIFIPWHFPLHEDKSISGSSQQAEEAFRGRYPAIFNHLLQFKTGLEKRNKEEVGKRYEWYALQRCAASYYDEFEKEKALYPIMSSEASFCYDVRGFFCNDKGFIITGEGLKYLVAVLNSKITHHYLKQTCSPLGDAAVEYRKIYLDLFPIPVITVENQNIVKQIEFLVEQIIVIKNGNKKSNTENLEKEIDKLAYQLYDLTETEIKIIEGN